MKVLCFGELLLRLASPGYTKLLQKDELETSFCGAEANVAVSLANFGIESSYVTKLPQNDIGLAARNSLRYFGVDVSNVKFGQGRMGTYYLEKGASQRPSKVIYDREYSAIAMAEKEEFDWEFLFDDVDWFHWSGINPALSNNLEKICESACSVAKKRGITISCDLNYRSNLWSQKEAKKSMSHLMKYVDVCIGNEEDADKVLGIVAEHTNVEKGKIDVSAYEDVARQICDKYGCKWVAFTLRESYSASRNGWSGLLYSKEQEKSYLSEKYDMQIVDRVGGGDSFSAGLIYGLISQKEPQEVINFAVAASCLKHSLEGDFNRCTVSEVESLLASGGNGRVQR